MDGNSADKGWTMLELLDWTTAHFQRAGIESPRLNAELLLGKAAGLERVMLYARFDCKPTPAQRKEFRGLVQRRAGRYPLQYLLGGWEFYGRWFELSEAVLVPRQETELLVDKCLEKVPADGRGVRAADIGTGSGVIAVTLACERPGLELIATDASAEALGVARRNAETRGVKERIAFHQGDLCDALPPEARGCLALIASNPPYVPSGEIERLEPEVRDHEPRLALDGGPDGLGVIRRLMPEAAEALGAGGWLVLELGRHAEGVRHLIEGIGLLEKESIETVRDAGGCERVLAVRRRANHGGQQ